jgi:plasmid maintenance system killer protein
MLYFYVIPARVWRARNPGFPVFVEAELLEALKRDRQGQHAIRINDQWRLCFKWHGGEAYDVEIVDYH